MEKNKIRLEKQINLLLKQYENCKTINNARIILSSLQSLLDLYKEVLDKEFIKRSELQIKNSFYYKKYVDFNNHKRNLFVRNFFKYRNFHQQFLSDIINEFDFFAYEYDFLYPEKHSKKELDCLFKEYCQDTKSNSYDIYKTMKDDNRFFSISKKDEYCAETSSDYFNKVDFVVFKDKNLTIENLITLIHEVGHVEDFMDMNASKLVDYTYRSPFSEVHSLKNEKEFYDYLLKNEIYADEIRDEVLSECDNIVESLVSLITYCEAPISYLDIPIYIKDDWKEKALQKTNLDIDFILNNFETFDFLSSYLYSYGELLATYFIEHPEKYEAFRSRRYDFFHPKLFKELEITSSDVAKSLYKRYDKYV